jgi:putative salt-induced outer membrane protein
MKTLRCTVAMLMLVGAAGLAAAEDRPWEFSLGLSYLATSGNTDTRTGGLDLSYKHKFDPWGLEVAGSYLKAEADGIESANRTFLGARGTRSLGEKWGLFVGASMLQDEFAGLDSRTLVDAGMTFKAVASEQHSLTFDFGAAWTSEDYVDGGSNEYVSGIAGLAYEWTISASAKLTERLIFMPSFEESDDWRTASDTALEAAISAKLAMKLGFQYLYDNVPVAGFEKTDTKSTVSLVVKL